MKKSILCPVLFVMFFVSCGTDDYDIPDQRETFQNYLENNNIDYVEQNGVYRQILGEFPTVAELGEEFAGYGELGREIIEQMREVEPLDSLADLAAVSVEEIFAHGEYLVSRSAALSTDPDQLEALGNLIASYGDTLAMYGREILEWADLIEESMREEEDPGDDNGEEGEEDEEGDGEDDDGEEEEEDDTLDRMRTIGASLVSLGEKITERGLYLVDKKDSFGENDAPVAETGDEVSIYYSIYSFRNNYGPYTLYWTNIRSDAEAAGFEETLMDFTPETFVLGEKGMMAGINLGIPGALEGDTFYLYITSDLGYHTDYRGNVPPNTPLVVKIVLDRVTKNN